jgi:hypothetical protein
LTIERELQDRDMPSPTICRLRSEDDRTRMLTKRDQTPLADLMRLSEPATLGDPELPLF